MAIVLQVARVCHWFFDRANTDGKFAEVLESTWLQLIAINMRDNDLDVQDHMNEDDLRLHLVHAMYLVLSGEREMTP